MPKPLLTEERRRRFHQALQAIDGAGLDGATVLGDGYTAQAWLLADGETVARVPKYAWAEMALVYEISILKLLEAAALPVATPREARQVRDSAGFVGALHRYLPGIPLEERMDAITGTPKAELLGRDLGVLLSALHAIPVERFPVGGAVPYPHDFERWMNGIAPYLDAPGNEWIEDVGERLAALPTEGRLVGCHGDIWDEHILLDADDRLCGLIDFGLASVADPVWDFRGLLGPADIPARLGTGFVRALLDSYTPPLAPDAEARALLYDDIDSVGDAYHELTYHGTTGWLEVLRERIANGPA